MTSKEHIDTCKIWARELLEAPGGYDLIKMVGFAWRRKARKFRKRWGGLEAMLTEVRMLLPCSKAWAAAAVVIWGELRGADSCRGQAIGATNIGSCLFWTLKSQLSPTQFKDFGARLQEGTGLVYDTIKTSRMVDQMVKEGQKKKEAADKVGAFFLHALLEGVHCLG